MFTIISRVLGGGRARSITLVVGPIHLRLSILSRNIRTRPLRHGGILAMTLEQDKNVCSIKVMTLIRGPIRRMKLTVRGGPPGTIGLPAFRHSCYGV